MAELNHSHTPKKAGSEKAVGMGMGGGGVHGQEAASRRE